MSRQSPDDRPATFKIGAVARLTGLSVHTLRKWEDRYGAVEPRRTPGGERIYTRTDLKRLAFIKRMADAGMSLRGVAKLSLAELEEAWRQVADTQPAGLGAEGPRKIRIVVLGDVLPALLERRAVDEGPLDVVAMADSEEDLLDAVGEGAVDVLIYECPNVQRETRHRINELTRRFGVRGVVVVYGFATRAHLAAMRRPDVAMMRAPVDPEELARIALGVLHGHGAGREVPAPPVAESDIPVRRLSNEAIARIAMSAPTVRCECPHHLADIVTGLLAFEEYSADCENLNAEDAELHHYLRATAAQARALFETAIVRMAELEGIELED